MDALIAENPGVSLEDLVTSKKINEDQKAQAQKKPGLQASLVQLEEQVVQYMKIDHEYQQRFAAEKNKLEVSFKEELQQVKDTAALDAATAAEASGKTELSDKLLVLSKFLRAAASKRQSGDEASQENLAFEGLLLLVYGGETGAVAAMESLIAGSDEKVRTVEGAESELSCKPFTHAPQLPRC